MDPVMRHWQDIDSALPNAVDDPTGGTRIEVDGGYGIATTERADLTELSSLWTDDLQHTLTPRVASPDAMDRLLTAWLESLPAAERGLTKISWPSRDNAMPAVFMRHGFQPASPLAIRPRGRAALAELPECVRPVRPEDADAITRLWLELVIWDAQFGNLLKRPASPQLIASATAEICGRPDSLSLVAEHDGEVVGVMLVHSAQHAAWVQDLTSATPAAYLAVGVTTRDGRSSGIGSSLARAAAYRADREHAATVLNYNIINPLSGPFWHRLGYRPLWLGWRRRA
ncbi:GNAT family N-acetyltransferase [Luteipulveratus mongoliensis]|uniref:N-acetyltransferase domain-containing protein n=1 Tax=Luteipulveratus mongoliensis TaxID=571913 RepID=A0A0K1JLB3_9MICO|nr:GNAT family N-acetyltransferase [Luteipulveratus mongoliensis]AKU17363.1 hypothetical protein VV02_18410 [Luteipulveratus mongoliensis]